MSEPLPQPLPLPLQLLPPPLDARGRRILATEVPPEKPSGHGCGYFDDGCPWNICYACEYERDPATYNERVRGSPLVTVIRIYFNNMRAGEAMHGVSVETLDAVIAELNKPVAERRFTAAEVAANAAVAAAAEDKTLLQTLHALLPYNCR